VGLFLGHRLILKFKEDHFHFSPFLCVYKIL
jgi:hypothetical protein